MCTDKGTAGESRCRKAKGLTEFFFARQPVAKKKSGKRFLSWLLAAVMIIALMPATAFAEPPTESSGNTETAVTSYCPSSEGGTDVSVGGYDSSPAAETKDTPTAEPVKDTQRSL